MRTEEERVSRLSSSLSTLLTRLAGALMEALLLCVQYCQKQPMQIRKRRYYKRVSLAAALAELRILGSLPRSHQLHTALGTGRPGVRRQDRKRCQVCSKQFPIISNGRKGTFAQEEVIIINLDIRGDESHC